MLVLQTPDQRLKRVGLDGFAVQGHAYVIDGVALRVGFNLIDFMHILGVGGAQVQRALPQLHSNGGDARRALIGGRAA